ncbi:hypothetical protein B0T16DRAFT_193644 [Cercophora newfieldiana]|uniref:Uncharacterized protein n=1 Tax=Cercophora newfieldiana TaxID=92897 RepID=A0AA40CMS6_9PEZI|nr:hypothetical protein B0T16DRAFT_193644 [Cercophora newfieldiana]
MNRFRTKKRAKDDTSAPRSSQESEHSSVFSKGFRRGKKNQPEEVKKEIDLATALPSTDDFRTSLLMSNLSARFSMLREQDDPNTKIGKASDDSVLYPKRQSRFADFGFAPTPGGLADIAEVESIKAPRFRTESYASDDDLAQSSSIMNRSKPLEGNNLFGGRQKIYKIPAGKGAGGGGMVGRALYEDDVALSSFQRWRKAERERRSLDGEDLNEPLQAEDDAEPLGYNRKRETSSTTSSASFARNSTAATSITSQQTGAVKDWQSSSTAPTSAASTPALERNVTRTRRLYEQGAQESLDQGLSKIDTFTRQKHFGSRTPDLGGNSPSPTTTGFAERLFAERRAALTKTSAPNLKAVSPPLSATSDTAAETASIAPGQSEIKPNFGGAPPLSPPLSEEDEQVQRLLSIQPNDVGKATAMGVFQKPSQPYDESKYAQRQIQLQQGRETPTGRLRAESNASFATARSQSSSSAHRQPSEPRTEPIKTQPLVEEETITLPQLSLEPMSLQSLRLTRTSTPQLNIERPSDMDHPAFRQSAAIDLPAISASVSAEVSPVSDKPSMTLDVPAEAAQVSPDHSPTLGVNPNSGLSGMVRQHLRSESTASSIYGPTPPASSSEPQFPIQNEPQPELPAPKSNPWLSPGQEWTSSFYGNVSEPSLRTDKVGVAAEPKLDPTPESKASSRSSRITEEETDEFASQLADARRRVREKLTSYVESDSSRAASPLSHSDSSKDLAPSNALGLGILKPKTSRGSLIDRSRNLVAGQTKPKLLGLGASTMSTSPNPSKQNFEDRETAPLEPMAEEPPREVTRDAAPALPGVQREAEFKTEKEAEEETKAHPGLRAFRQARRELQRNKELEMLAKHQTANNSQPSDPSTSSPSRPSNEYGSRQRTPSRERRPPPISYRQRERAPSEEYQQGSNTNSPTASKTSGERERSGSDTSGRSSSRPRPPRLRGNIGHHDDQFGPGNPNRQPGLHAPGLPGTDIRRSPIMPPQGAIRGALSPAASPHMLHSSKSAGNLGVHSNRPAYEPNYGMPSPISPSGLPPPSPYALGPGASPVGTPTSFGPRSRQNSAAQSPAFGPVNGGPGGPTRRMVDKRDISEPTFVMSTSRVPTVNLPQQMDGRDMGSGNRQYGGQRYARDGNTNPSSAPPLPPINPRRKRENSRTRPYDDAGLGAPRLPFASQGNGSTSSLDYAEDDRSVYSEEEDNQRAANPRQRLPPTRKAQFEGGAPPRGPGRRDNSPPFVAKGPPASRTVLTSNIKVNPNMNVPGGMF